MQVAHRNDEVHGVGPVIRGKIDILAKSANIGTAFGREACIGDKPDGLPFSFRGSCRTDLNYVYADIRQVRRNIEFLNRC